MFFAEPPNLILKAEIGDNRDATVLPSTATGSPRGETMMIYGLHATVGRSLRGINILIYTPSRPELLI